MTIQFIPLGSAVSSSFAISSSIAFTSANVPTTAALAEHAVNLVGPMGFAGLTTSSFALIVEP